MKLLKLANLILLLTFHSIIAQVDNIKFEQIYQEEGLSHGNVTCILQDKQGFMWFGTWNGLNRFDGYSMKVYRHDSSNPKSISDDFILCIYEDSTGTIWIGTFDGGLNKYDKETDSFISYKNKSNDVNSIPNNQVSCIFEDSDGDLWLSCINKLVKFDQENNHFITIKEVKPGATIEILEHPKGIFWLSTFGDGLYKYDKTTGSSTHYLHNSLNKNSLAYNVIADFCKGQGEELWIGTYGGGLDLFDIKTGIFSHFKHEKENNNSLVEDKILNICRDYKGNIWIGTDNNGVDKYYPKRNKFIHYKNNNLSNIDHNSIKTIYESRDHIIWLGTYGEGVNKYNNNNKQFIHYQNNPNNPNSINGDQAKAFFEDQYGMLWVSIYENGINRIDRKNNTNTIFKHNPDKPFSISNNSTWHIFEDSFGELWFGTLNGLCKFNRNTNQFKRYLYEENIINNKGLNIWTILEDKSGEFWLGTMGSGLYKFNRKTEEYVVYKNIPDDRTSLNHNNILALYEDSQGLFWVGTDEGLEIFDRKTETFTHFVNNPKNTESISDNDIISICEDSNGNLWFGTEGGGMNLLNRKNMSFTRYNESNGLSNNVVLAIIEENASEKQTTRNLWISTHYGISKFNPKNKTFRNYDASDGLQGNEFSINSYYKNKNGEIFFGGYNGFTTFYPDSIKDDLKPPEVVITELKIFNIPVEVGQKINNNIILTKVIEKTQKIILTHKEYVFSLDFTALHYAVPNKNKYAYFLEGFSEKWIYTDANRRFATFTNLDRGTYLFKVKASNNDGIWNEKGASLKIIILPPFWETTWFKIMGIALFFLTLYLWYLRRVSTIKEQKRILEQQVKERTHEILEKNEELKQQKEEIETQRDALEDVNATKDKFFSIISHDLKSPFNALLGFSELLTENYHTISKEKGASYVRQIFTSSKQLYELVENLLSWSRTKTNSITSYPEDIDLHIITNNIKETLRLILNKKYISIVNNIVKDTYIFADPNLTSTILRNLISNAIKFSQENSQITINSKDNEAFIEVSVSDTGVGISEEDIPKLFKETVHYTTKGTKKEKGTGLGLILCKEFVKINKGKIWVKSELGKGTTFFFTLPKEKYI